MSVLNKERTALILVEAAYFGDPATSQKWGIAERTIRNYRQRLNDDTELASLFQDKKELFESDWAADIPAAIRTAVNFLQRASKQADPQDHENIHAVAGALKIMSEVALTKAILDVRLNGFGRQNGTEDQALVAIRRITDGRSDG